MSEARSIVKTLQQFKEKCMQDPDFAKEYKEMEEEFEEIRSSIESSMEVSSSSASGSIFSGILFGKRGRDHEHSGFYD